MAMGRGSAIVSMLLLCLVILHFEMAHAATYTVGGAGGWTFNVDSWPNGKRFKAGDILVFNYSPQTHNVVAVDKGGYSACTTPRGAKVYQKGKDQIKLVKGQNFFICSISGHCQSGMKIAVTAV
ncbi:Cu_bind_like domain-containing protein [Cephalotus follicularis]|uniref:Basic blue protein n=1 Tax=Cephalotus follicularis TaxID=3775 RepID=A0A1Q3BHN2_CEPFO|nr:Cu_bind_like domain-containing protein [Cephalotus follicularis]